MDTSNNPYPKIDFGDTAIAFAGKTDEQLKKAAFLFSMMNKPFLVKWGSKAGLLAFKLGLPVQPLVKNTIFEQFCGGTSIEECESTIAHLNKFGMLSILDYGAEAKSSEDDFNKVAQETTRALQFAVNHDSVPVISTKLTGIASFGLLEKIQRGEELTARESIQKDNALTRLNNLCLTAKDHKVSIFVDAEESWIQDTIDDWVEMMMAQYNQERAIIFNTFQLYRHDKLAYLKTSYEKAQAEGYILGAKLVRGAYMVKERDRAEEMGYQSPIQKNKAATDKDYDEAVEFCVEHYEGIASCNATHNKQSCLLEARLIAQKGLDKQHPHLNFCQLYGMSDHLSFNLKEAGYNVAKYVPYGRVKEVMPYLIRRAQENTSVTGDMSRELALIQKEIKRRGL